MIKMCEFTINKSSMLKASVSSQGDKQSKNKYYSFKLFRVSLKPAVKASVLFNKFSLFCLEQFGCLKCVLICRDDRVWLFFLSYVHRLLTNHFVRFFQSFIQIDFVSSQNYVFIFHLFY